MSPGLDDFIERKEIKLENLQKETSVLKSIRDTSKLNLEESLSLLTNEATTKQLKEMTPAIYDIAINYDYTQFPKQLPEERIPYTSNGPDSNDPPGLLPLNLVSKYLINVIRAIGGEEGFYKKLRSSDNQPTTEEMYYVWTIIAIQGYNARAKDFTRLERKDLLIGSVDTAKKLLNLK